MVRMTAEEIKNIVRHVFHFYEVNAENCNWADINEACGEVFKALDAKNAVKNIISDIENIRIHRYRETETDTGDISANCFRYETLEIINKYFLFKAESEG